MLTFVDKVTKKLWIDGWLKGSLESKAPRSGKASRLKGSLESKALHNGRLVIVERSLESKISQSRKLLKLEGSLESNVQQQAEQRLTCEVMNETCVKPKEHVIRKRFHNNKFENARLRKKVFPL